MSLWTAIVPIKPPGERKSRLAARLDSKARHDLSEAMLRHVLEVLARSPGIGATVVLSRDRPPAWRGGWATDGGAGLNAELQLAIGRTPRPILVIHADLPTLTVEDVAELIAAADDGIAFAPDRRRAGTNAVALGSSAEFAFAFGPNSLERHLASAGPSARTVMRPGLALDIDVPDDLDSISPDLWRPPAR